MNAHELKQKQVRLTKLEAEIKEDEDRLSMERQAVQVKQREAGSLRAAINAFFEAQKRSEMESVVSEHAMIRYFERVAHIDLDAVRKEILTDAAKDMIRQLGNGTYPVNGFKIKVQDGCVTTII